MSQWVHWTDWSVDAETLRISSWFSELDKPQKRRRRTHGHATRNRSELTGVREPGDNGKDDQNEGKLCIRGGPSLRKLVKIHAEDPRLISENRFWGRDNFAKAEYCYLNIWNMQYVDNAALFAEFLKICWLRDHAFCNASCHDFDRTFSLPENAVSIPQ